MSNATPGVFRKTMTDVQVNGIILLTIISKKMISVKYNIYIFIYISVILHPRCRILFYTKLLY